MASTLQTPISTRATPRIPAPSRSSVSAVSFATLYCDGQMMCMVQVEPDGLVDVAVRELGARLVAVGWVIPDPN